MNRDSSLTRKDDDSRLVFNMEEQLFETRRGGGKYDPITVVGFECQ